MSEKDLQNACLEYLNMLPDSLAYECYNGGLPACARGSRIIYKRKNQKNRPNGFPDCIWFVQGEVILFEFKVDKGKVSKEQEAMHARLAEIGFEVYVIRSLSELIDLADNVLRRA